MSRKFFLTGVIGCLFLVLLWNLFRLQISSQVIYHQKSEANSIREEIVHPVRGSIYDCKGYTLVENRPSYSLQIVPSEVNRKKSLTNFLFHKLNIDTSLIRKRLGIRWRGYQPVKVGRIRFRELSLVEEYKLNYPGMTYTSESGRYYPNGVRMPHVLGYIKEISEEEINAKGDPYMPGDNIGKKGIERYYEEFLRGEKSRRFLEVDVHGRVLGEVRDRETPPAEAGMNIHLTINLKLQQLIEEKMKDKKGAAVVINPNDGSVLAIVSKPDYDPNYIGWNFSNKEWANLNSNPESPLYNRSVTGTYPPGSTLKIVTAIAAINEKIATPDQKYTCGGTYVLGRRAFHCWNHGGHGTLDMYEAIAQSCNIYFFKLAQSVGLDKWIYYMDHFKFGRKTGIDMQEENPGILPDKKYYRKKRDSDIVTEGDLLNLAIGQGETLVTPLQMAMFASIIATKGLYARPHLLNYMENPETGERRYYVKHVEEILDISMDAFDVVRKGMLMVTESLHGTAKAARIPNYHVGGKTGTAQNPGKDHAWFIGFAPFDNPQVALAIVVENAGGGGGAIAAPIAGAAFNYLLNEDEPVSIMAGGN